MRATKLDRWQKNRLDPLASAKCSCLGCDLLLAQYYGDASFKVQQTLHSLEQGLHSLHASYQCERYLPVLSDHCYSNVWLLAIAYQLHPLHIFRIYSWFPFFVSFPRHSPALLTPLPSLRLIFSSQTRPAHFHLWPQHVSHHLSHVSLQCTGAVSVGRMGSRYRHRRRLQCLDAGRQLHP